MIRPVDAEISQRFGDNPTRNLPADSWLIQTFGNYQPDGHTGEDYACAVGTPVRAVADGTVLHIGWMGGTYADNPWWIQPSFAGYHAIIDHGSFIGIYGHCSDGSAKVSKGDRVTEGQVFILSGNTGGSTGPHLHFEVLPDGYVLNSTFYGRIDPEPFFTSSISVQSASITTPVQEDDMGYVDDLSDEAAAKIARHVHDLQVDREGGGTNTLRWSLSAESQRTEGIISRTAEATARLILNAAIARGGGSVGGETSLAGVVAYFDQNRADILNAIGKPSESVPGLNPEQVNAAIKAGLDAALSGTTATITLGGGK